MSDTIMVAGDDDGLQLTVSAILEDEGYDVVIAGDGLEALEELQLRRPALILLDIGMPRMNGFAFADELRRRGCIRESRSWC